MFLVPSTRSWPQNYVPDFRQLMRQKELNPITQMRKLRLGPASGRQDHAQAWPPSSHLGFLWPISRSKFLLLTISDLHSVSVTGRGEQLRNYCKSGHVSEAHWLSVLLSKPVATPGPKGWLLGPRWMDGRAGL